MTLNTQYIGKRIREARKRKEITQQQFSELIDKTPSYVSYIERGIRSMSLETFAQIVNVLEVSADLLLMDHVVRNQTAANQEMSSLLADCSRYELLVIMDMVKAVKSSLRANKSKARM